MLIHDSANWVSSIFIDREWERRFIACSYVTLPLLVVSSGQSSMLRCCLLVKHSAFSILIPTDKRTHNFSSHLGKAFRNCSVMPCCMIPVCAVIYSRIRTAFYGWLLTFRRFFRVSIAAFFLTLASLLMSELVFCISVQFGHAFSGYC